MAKRQYGNFIKHHKIGWLELGIAQILFLLVDGHQCMVKELVGLNENIEGREVILLEDIVDTGITLENLYQSLEGLGAISIKVATLLFKPNAYTKSYPIDYAALEVGNEFLVGYGLDYDGLGRNLKDIYIITED